MLCLDDFRNRKLHTARLSRQGEYLRVQPAIAVNNRTTFECAHLTVGRCDIKKSDIPPQSRRSVAQFAAAQQAIVEQQSPQNKQDIIHGIQLRFRDQLLKEPVHKLRSCVIIWARHITDVL